MKHSNQIYIVDDDAAVRDSLTVLLETHDYKVESFEDGEHFLRSNPELMAGVVLLDIRMPGRNGIDVLDEIQRLHTQLSVVMMSGHADIATAVIAIKNGASDFVEKPFHVKDLLPKLEKVFLKLTTAEEEVNTKIDMLRKFRKLTERERQVMACIVDGKPNKTIATDLNISVRTVETHRARLMSKLDAKSVSDLVKLSIGTQAT